MIKRHRSEVFFERGRLYTYCPTEDLPSRIPLYDTEDIAFAIEEADRKDYTPFLLQRALSFLSKDDVLMLIEIRRYSYSYNILKVLVGDQIYGIILYEKLAMYPWEVFKSLS